MKACARCKSKVPQSSRFCKYCGSPEFMGEEINCPHCQASLPRRDINFCMECGRRINEDRPAKQRVIIAVDGETHICGICRQKVKTDLVFCPSCIASFHYNHVSSWIIEKSECPICKVTLKFAE